MREERLPARGDLLHRIEELEREGEELRLRLAEERAAHHAFETGQIDAVLDPVGGGALLLEGAQAALRASEERYRTMVTTAHEGIWTADATGITFANERMASMLGYTSDELIGLRSEDLVDASALEEVPLGFERRREGVRDRRDLPLRKKDGTILWASVTSSPLVDAEGKFAGSLGMVTDITERRRLDEQRQAAEAGLRESEERYRALFDESPMPMWAYDAESLEIVMANQAAAEQYGYTTDELESMLLPEIRPPEVGEEQIREVNRALPLGRQNTGIWRHRRKDGGLIDVDVHLNDVCLGGRRLRLAILHDVTQRRTLEEQLRQSQKMEAVGRLAGGVAHDFNNLLTSILGYSDLLANRFQLGDPERAEIQEIRRAAERAAALTRQLLAFSRKQVLVPEVLDLGSIVRGLSGMLERLIGEHIAITVSVAPGVGRVLADPGQMEQVVMNLALNARDAMPGGGELLIEIRNIDLGEAHVGEKEGAAPGPYVLLAVTDTGVGMSPDVRKKIFEPFFTTKPAGQGTGLGLSTVHGIVNQSGGTIWVYSEQGRGTTFKIYLPRIVGDVEEPRSATGSFPALRGTGTILLVEDEEQLRRLGTRILELNHYTVLEATGPLHALELARAHAGAIDLLLTDVVMPGMSGTDLAAALLLERPGMPVLYMSGYTDDAIVHHGVLSPGAQFMQKPFTPSALVERVRRTMNPPPPG